ncbi:MAG: hypothetical protein KatS3mg087_1278 [Patescibacteria group bacterium]|nr:MAG: hypothetical protein KatS3mg087_1278 [Patescibacteria group bacterium]
MCAKEDMTISLQYTGEDVKNGTISVEDIVPALQGLSTLYGRLVSHVDSENR